MSHVQHKADAGNGLAISPLFCFVVWDRNFVTMVARQPGNVQAVIDQNNSMSIKWVFVAMTGLEDQKGSPT
jgi:hypothetical protein